MLEALAAPGGAPGGLAERLRAAADRMEWDRAHRGVALSAQRRDTALAALRAGLPVSAAARLAGVSERTLYRERDRDAEFERDWAVALEAGAEAIETRLESIALIGEPGAMATVRAAETLLRGKSPRYRQSAPGVRPAAVARMETPGGTLSVSVGTPMPD